MSLAIGKEGQNARLAARLTGFKIDIKSETQAKESGEFMDYENDYEDYDEGSMKKVMKKVMKKKTQEMGEFIDGNE